MLEHAGANARKKCEEIPRFLEIDLFVQTSQCSSSHWLGWEKMPKKWVRKERMHWNFGNHSEMIRVNEMARKFRKKVKSWGFSKIQLDFDEFLTKLHWNWFECTLRGWSVYVYPSSMHTHLPWGWRRTLGRNRLTRCHCAMTASQVQCPSFAGFH